MMDFSVINESGTALDAVSPAVIKVIGCGGGGSNAVNRMIDADIANVDFIVLNTDVQDLNRSKAETRLAIGRKIAKGLGAGGNPKVGEEAAEEDKEAIANLLEGTDMYGRRQGYGIGSRRRTHRAQSRRTHRRRRYDSLRIRRAGTHASSARRHQPFARKRRFAHRHSESAAFKSRR